MKTIYYVFCLHHFGGLHQAWVVSIENRKENPLDVKSVYLYKNGKQSPDITSSDCVVFNSPRNAIRTLRKVRPELKGKKLLLTDRDNLQYKLEILS